MSISDAIKQKLQGAFVGQVLVLTALLFTAMITAATMGYIAIPPADVLKAVAAALTGNAQLLEGVNELFPVVVVDVRLPRILSATLVGSGLALSGAVFQGILLNPLADPYTLGVSAGAAFGASVAILLNIGLMGAYSIPLFAFCGAVATLFFVIYLSSTSGEGLSSNNLILSGIIVAAILSAGISFLKYVADEQVSHHHLLVNGQLRFQNLAGCRPGPRFRVDRICHLHVSSHEI